MAIKHSTTKAPGEKLFAVADWNAGHTIEDDTIMPDVVWSDNKRAYFGTGKDDYMYFDGADFYESHAGTYTVNAANGIRFYPQTFYIILGDAVGAHSVQIWDSTFNTRHKFDSDGNAVHYGTLRVGNAYTFPATDGNANEVLVTDGLGGVTWQPQAGGGAATRDFFFPFPDATTSALLAPCFYAVVDMTFGMPPATIELSGQFPQDFNNIVNMSLVYIPLVPSTTFRVNTMFAPAGAPYNAGLGGVNIGPMAVIPNTMLEVSIAPAFVGAVANDKFGVSVTVTGPGEAHCLLGVRLVYT